MESEEAASEKFGCKGLQRNGVMAAEGYGINRRFVFTE